MRLALSFLLLLLPGLEIAAAQSYNPQFPPNTFRNADNPEYWKNRKPFEALRTTHLDVWASQGNEESTITPVLCSLLPHVASCSASGRFVSTEKHNSCRTEPSLAAAGYCR